MAKIARVQIEHSKSPYWELIATSIKDVEVYGQWAFKIKPFRYVFIPNHEVMVARWVDEIDQNLQYWTQYSRIRDMVQFIRGGARKRFILYQLIPKPPKEETPGYAAFFDSEANSWVAPVNFQQLAIKELAQLEQALEKRAPVSLAGGMIDERTGESITFDAILKALELRAKEILAKKLTSEGVYLDPNELLADAAWHGIEMQQGAIVPGEIYRDQAMVYRVYDWLLAILQKRGFIARGDVIPTSQEFRSWLAVDFGRLKRELNEDIMIGMTGWMFWENLHEYATEQYGGYPA